MIAVFRLIQAPPKILAVRERLWPTLLSASKSNVHVTSGREKFSSPSLAATQDMFKCLDINVFNAVRTLPL